MSQKSGKCQPLSVFIPHADCSLFISLWSIKWEFGRWWEGGSTSGSGDPVALLGDRKQDFDFRCGRKLDL